jgi:hypothetical protein
MRSMREVRNSPAASPPTLGRAVSWLGACLLAACGAAPQLLSSPAGLEGRGAGERIALPPFGAWIAALE